MKRRQKKNNVSGERESSPLPIPVDLILDIFSRLPLKSIATCRCVSKLWNSLLRRQDFTDLFFTKSSARPAKLLFARQKDGNLLLFSAPQPQDPDKNSSPVVSADRLMRFSGFNFDNSYRMSGLVQGLVCLVHMVPGTKDMVPVLYSPTTGQSLILPKLETRRNRVKCLLGYDPVDKQFKVLSITLPLNGSESRDDMVSEEHQVLTVGGTGKKLSSWRTIQCSLPHLYPRKEICINGVLYYTSLYNSCMIVCFDVRSEKFSLIEVKGSGLRRALLGFMVNCDGKLGFIMSENQQGGNAVITSGRSAWFRLWVLEDVGKEEWSERVYQLPAEWNNLVGEHLLRFVGVVARTNEIVLSSWYTANPFYLFHFNPERDTVVRVEIQGVDMDGSSFDILDIFLDHVEDVKLYAKVHQVVLDDYCFSNLSFSCNSTK